METVQIDAETATKASIIAQFASTFRFPDYWQPNWDSFIDCMRDVAEVSSEPIRTDIRVGTTVPIDVADFMYVMGLLGGEFDNVLLSVNDNAEPASERKIG